MALIAVRDGPGAPPGVAGRDLDDGAFACRDEQRVDLVPIGFALHAEHPAHDVDALRVPAGVDPETGRAADGGCLPRRRGLGDALLDAGVRRELAGLVGGLGRPEAPRAGQDRDGERLEVAEGAPLRPGVAKTAGLVSRVDAHRFLPRGWLAERRGTPSPVAGSPLPVPALPLGAGNALGRRWKPVCCGAGTDSGTCPERAGYARDGEAVAMPGRGNMHAWWPVSAMREGHRLGGAIAGSEESTMNKAAIVARVAARLGLSRIRAEIAMDTVLDAIAEGLAKEEDVRISGFGTFRTKHRAARTGRNPKTGESVQIPALKSPSFKAAKGLREAVKRGWQAEAAEPSDDGEDRPGSAGAMLEMSDWPGGVEPVWTLLEPASIEALRAEPAADNATLRLAADLPDEAFGESAFVRNALIALELIGNEFLPSLTEKGRFGRDMVASMREAMTWPGMEATEQFRAGKTLREGDVWELHLLHRLMELAGLIEGEAFLGQLTSLAREMREPGRRGALQALLFRHLFWHADLSDFVETFPPRAAGAVAAGRYRRDPLGALERGWGVAERGHARGLDHGSRRCGRENALECGGHDVRRPRPGAAALVRAARIPGASRRGGGGLAQDRPVRSLPVVRCPVRGRPRWWALTGVSWALRGKREGRRGRETGP